MKTLVIAAVIGSTIALAVDLKGAKCPVSGKKINKKASLDHNGGKVYFCCMDCPKAFKKDTAKYETKANHQLVATKQVKQKACPVTGKKLNPDTKIAVAGIDVTFCCPNCQKKVNKAEGDAQLKLVFGAKAFKKAFAVAKKK